MIDAYLIREEWEGGAGDAAEKTLSGKSAGSIYRVC